MDVKLGDAKYPKNIGEELNKSEVVTDFLKFLMTPLKTTYASRWVDLKMLRLGYHNLCSS